MEWQVVQVPAALDENALVCKKNTLDQKKGTLIKGQIPPKPKCLHNDFNEWCLNIQYIQLIPEEDNVKYFSAFLVRNTSF
jgi:hypothetical protein